MTEPLSEYPQCRQIVACGRDYRTDMGYRAPILRGQLHP